ncbi:nuclear transport factor 2 family protein [Polyangium mundeleinium]|uniref:Nuclear transport factor 2 family protein n=1 Tax=Polyangium mundeleinium TaxID=2995306 RepID=A0ABT5ENH5_9BACT|nr:nuclear transport factor 2 family protein [Polyangium mundeleinium]MDC0743034.1 nuclear transport factor 2 family protein [Polyangium mundeleinium]
MTSTGHRNAAQALDEHLALISKDIQRWIELFADDAVVEFPYAPPGLPARLEGKAAIDAYFRPTPQTFAGLTFSDVRRYVTTDPDVALAEVHGTAQIPATGKRYEQDYIMVLRTRAGKIVHYREYWNVGRALEAFGDTDAVRNAVGAS